MLVFVDEAGDTGFKFADNSSRYFVVTLVIFEDEEQVEQTGERILRHGIRARPALAPRRQRAVR